MSHVYQQFKWVLAHEDKEIADRDKELTVEDRIEIAKRRTASLMHYKRVKKQIKQAIREAEEEAKHRRIMESEAKKQAELRARENAWKYRQFPGVSL